MVSNKSKKVNNNAANKSTSTTTSSVLWALVAGILVIVLMWMKLFMSEPYYRGSDLVWSWSQTPREVETSQDLESFSVATLAWWCFRCIEQPFEQLDGVAEVIVWYAWWTEENATYKKVTSWKTNHVETAQIYYDPEVISYEEILDVYWILIDPTDDGGQFVDRGPQYKPVIFYHDEQQRLAAEKSKKALEESQILYGLVRTPIKAYPGFYKAEEYHQDFYKKSPDVYKNYKENSGR